MKHKAKTKKIWLCVAGGLLALLVIMGLMVSAEVGRQTGEGVLHCNDGNDTKNNSIKQLELWGYDLAGFQSRWPEQPATVTSGDGTIIPVGVYQPSGEPVGAVILVHGHGGDRVSVAPLAEQYLQQNYLVYAMDQRASGDSQNPLVSFGYFEKNDVAALVDYARQQQPGLPVVVHGQSMGAATAALYGATDHARQNLSALVLDSAFDSMKRMVLGVMGMENLMGEYFALCGNWYLKNNYGFTFADADVVKQASKIQTPTLVIQCARDEIAPIWVGEAIYQAVNSPAKAYWQADSEHVKAVIDYPDEYQAQVMDFLQKALAN